MNNIRREPISESEIRTVKLDNNNVSVKEFNETVESLKPNQRIIETSDNNFHLVERMFS